MRQGLYAYWLQASVYTPQVVVNGSKEFVGPQEGTLLNAIKSGLQQLAANSSILSQIKKFGGKVSLQFKVESKDSNTSVVLALVQIWGQSRYERRK